MSSNANAAASAGIAAQQACILWRDTSVGMALMDSLDELIESGHIPPQLAQKVVAQFDKRATEVLGEHKAKCSVKAKLHVYRLCDEVWTFSLRNAMFKMDNGETVGPLAKVKVVAQKSAYA